MKNLNKKIDVYFFKKEGCLKGIQPLCQFKIYQFDLQNILNSKDLYIKIIRINKERFIELIEFITKKKALFKAWILPDITNFQNLINFDIYIVFAKLDDFNKIENIYIFQKTNILFKKQSSIELSASIISNNNQITKELNYIVNLLSKDNYKYLNIVNMNNNIFIIDNVFNLAKKYDYEIECQYIFFNYKFNKLKNNEIFILA